MVDASNLGALAQDEIVRLRSRLLGGRGPGATSRETLPYMGARPTVGPVPTVIARELVSVHTNMARGDADAIEADLLRTRADAAGALRAAAAGLAPLWIAVRAAAFGAAATLALGLLLRRVEPQRTRLPRRSRRRPPVR